MKETRQYKSKKAGTITQAEVVRVVNRLKRATLVQVYTLLNAPKSTVRNRLSDAVAAGAIGREGDVFFAKDV